MALDSDILGRIWNTTLAAADKLLGLEKVMARPMRIHLEINDFCNLKCPHCPRENPAIPKNTGHIPIEAIRNLVPWFKRATYVGLTGNGEPFLHPQIMEVLRIIIDAGAVPSTTSNATLWKKLGVIDNLVAIGPMLLNVSIDGGTKATFEKWRLKANFEEVRANLLELRQAKDRAKTPFPIVNFITVLMEDNIGEVEQIVDWGAEAGVSVITFQNMFPYNTMMEEARVKDVERCRTAIGRASQRARQHGIRIDWLPMSVDVDERGTVGGSYGDLTTADARQALHGAAPNGDNGVRYHCDNVWNTIHVTVSGDIKFCCFWTQGPVGNLLKDDFEDIWNGEEWRALRRDIMAGKKPRPCVGCHNLVVADKKRMLRASARDIKDLMKR